MEFDVELLNRHRAPQQDLVSEEGCFTNWLGLRTDASLFGGAEQLSGKIFPAVPYRGDGVYGGYVEYASLLKAIESCSNRSEFNAIELGAGWGPWISAIGVVCRRMGFTNVKLVGVEADEGRAQLMREHLSRNHIDATVLHGAAWSENTTLRFPKIDSRRDHGGAPSEEANATDYRGISFGYVDIPAFSLETIAVGMSIIDYAHWDIQGAEYDVASAAIDFMNTHVRYAFIGTHSAPIEGRLLDLFFNNRWNVLHHNPCLFDWDINKPSIEGMTTRDGELFIENPRFI